MCHHCRATEHVIRLICKLYSTEDHSIDACKLGTMPNNHCQYCQNMGHEVTKCPTIAEYKLCWKCKERRHDPLTCNKASRITESCEGCGSAAHTIKNCPSALCTRKKKKWIQLCRSCNSNMNSSVSEYIVKSTLATHVKVTEAMVFTSGVQTKMLFLLNTHVESTGLFGCVYLSTV